MFGKSKFLNNFLRTNWVEVTVSDWDLADEIETKEDVIGILEAALEENDPEFLWLFCLNTLRV